MKPDAEEDSFKKLALIMAVACVRNTCIEEFHARPQPQFLSDADMKRFNREVADKLYTFLHYLLRADPAERARFMAIMEPLLPYNWDQPSLYPGMVAAVEGKIRTPEEVKRATGKPSGA